jgi:hypothetical protein
MTPGWWFEDDLKRVSNSFDPAHWSGDRREIEFAFDDLEMRLEKEQRAERKAFVQGYDARAVDQATGEILQRLRDNMTGLRPEQQWGSQEAMNQVKNGVRRDLAINPHYQQQRSEALSDLANDQAEQTKRLNDRQAEVLQANGFEPGLEQVREEQHTDALLRMGEILSDTRQDIQRLDEIDGLTNAEDSLQEAKTAIDAEAQAKEERRKAFFASMDRTDQQEQELQKLRR